MTRPLSRTAPQRARETQGSTKDRILQAAEEVFAERGFNGASTREIAARAGVNISSLHYHWESKETLYLAVFRDVYERLERRLQEAIRPYIAERRSTEDVIAASIDGLFAFFTERPTLPRLLLRRVIDEDTVDVGIERDVLAPTWSGFLRLIDPQHDPSRDLDARLFVLTVHAVQLAYMLDSKAYRSFLGGSVHEEPFKSRVREHLIKLMRHMLPQ